MNIELYKDRTLNVADFKRNIKATGPDAEAIQKSTDAVYELIKNDADGNVTADEFNRYLEEMEDKSIFDTDGSGDLNKKEKEAAWISALSVANPDEIFTISKPVSTEGSIFAE